MSSILGTAKPRPDTRPHTTEERIAAKRAKLAALEAKGEAAYEAEWQAREQERSEILARIKAHQAARDPKRPGGCGRARSRELGIAASSIPRCGIQKTDGSGPCTRPAGFGTDHFGSGRCKFHWGNNGKGSITHGRYSGRLPTGLDAVVQHYCDDNDPLNMEQDIALVRGLVEQWINDYDKWFAAVLAWHESYLLGDIAGKPTKVLELTDGYKILDALGKLVEKEYKRRQNGMVSQIHLFRIVNQIGLVIEKHVTDRDALIAIRDEMLSIRLPGKIGE